MNQHRFAKSDTSTPSAMEGRRARKARMTRRGLLDAGLNAFHRQPISLVSVLDITEAADVAKGVFYLHFPSKDAFLIALWDDVQSAFLDVVGRAAAAASQGDDDGKQTRFAAAIGQYARFAAEYSRRVCFLLRMSSFLGDELGTPGQLAERREAYIDALARAVTGADEKTRPRKADVEAARAMDAVCWGIIWQGLQHGRRSPSAKDLIRIVLPAVRPAAQGGNGITSVEVRSGNNEQR